MSGGGGPGQAPSTAQGRGPAGQPGQPRQRDQGDQEDLPGQRGPAEGAEWLLLGCGVVAAMHVGKLPPALPVLRESLGIPLVQAGFLLSTVQLGSMGLGLVLGLSAQRIGLKRALLGGLWMLALASAAGALATGAPGLLAARAAEGVGVLLVALSAPSLLRRLVPPQRQALRLGLWGTYMPTGTGLALLIGPMALMAAGWQGWWVGLGLLSAAAALAASRVLPRDPPPGAIGEPAQRAKAGARTRKAAPAQTAVLRDTLRRRAPWLLAACFGAYSAQWLTVIGFLPTVYADAGLAGSTAGVLTAVAALANALGNVAGGRLLHRGAPALTLLWAGFGAMAAGALLAFAGGDTLPFAARYGAVLLFSGVGGLVPSTLFALGGQVSPDPRAMPVVVGLLTQGTGAGQFLGPPAAAWWAASQGSWSQTGWATGCAALLGALLAWALHRAISRAPQASSAQRIRS